MRYAGLIGLLVSGTVMAQTDYRQWEQDLSALSQQLTTLANAAITNPPDGQQFTADAIAKLNAAALVAADLADVSAAVVAEVYEDIPPPPPPGQPDIFGRNQYVLELHRDIPGLSQLSGATAGPNGSLWVITDRIEQGGFLHEITWDGDLIRSINLTGNQFDPEDVCYLFDTQPGIGLWAICSEAGNKGVFVFEFPHAAPNGYAVDLTQGWYYPIDSAGESMAYLPHVNQLHLWTAAGYRVVEFDYPTGTFAEHPAPIDIAGMSGSLRSWIKGSSYNYPSLFRVQSNTTQTTIQECDITTPGLHPNDRVIGTFNSLIDAGEHPIKAEGGPVFFPNNPEAGFVIVNEEYWYQSRPAHTFRRFVRVE